MKKVLLFVSLFLMLLPASSFAAPSAPPILVVDKCPEFCPPGWKPPVEPVVDRCPEFCPGWRPPAQICTQALIPVPGRPGAWYTDGCKKTIIWGPSKPKNCLSGVTNGKRYMPTRECTLTLEKEKKK